MSASPRIPTYTRYKVSICAYQIGEERDRNHWQYLVAFDPHGGELSRPTRWLAVGGGSQKFERLTIENKVITLIGVKYLPGDAMASPSGKTTVKYIFLNGQLVARGS